jgi:hypothetical protein
MGTSNDVKKAIQDGILDVDEVIEACKRRDTSLDNPDFCISCGAERDGCEPDARNYPCDECGQRTVFGAEEIVMMVA